MGNKKDLIWSSTGRKRRHKIENVGIAGWNFTTNRKKEEHFCKLQDIRGKLETKI